MPNMDYSLIHRTPDGTGKILVTTPGSPDKGSFVLEADMKIYTNQGMVAIADIVDDLVTADAAKPLSANQGVVLKQLIDAFSGGIVPKGDILSTDLPPADASNKGWQYYCTDTNQWATSDGTQWIMTSNNVITQTPDATDTGHALSNAVVTQCCNEVKGKLNQHESRLENLEQKAGDYTIVQYRGTNAVPTGKAKNGLVEKIVGKSRAWNQMVDSGTSSVTLTNGHKYLTVINGTFSIVIGAGSAISVTGGTDCVYDLTLIFGSGNEPSTVADALAQLPALGQYNAYDAGSLVSTTVSGVKSVGINLFDKDGTFVDAYCDGSGVFYGNYGTLNAKSVIIKVKSGQTYYFNTGNKNGGMQRCAFTREYPTIGDRIYNASGTNTYGTYTNGSTVTVPTGFMYMIVTFFRSDVSNDGYDNVRNALCINVSDISINGQYYPYMTDTLTLPSPVTLRSVGNVADELDLESGEKTNPLRSANLSTLNWTHPSADRAITTDLASVIKQPVNTTSLGNYLSANPYTQRTASSTLSNEGDYAVTDTGGIVFYYNGTDPSGLFYFELATPDDPTQLTPVIDNTIQTEGGGTIETIQTQTPVIDNCLDVGYLTV